MSLGVALILSTALVAVPANCSWAHPGANPYRGDPVRALGDFGLPVATREKLRAAMAAHRTTDVVTITRDDIVGTHGYADLREMHSGGGRVCHGAVDRSAWSATRREPALVYCADDACVIVPTICNNVSLVTRRPEREAAIHEEPIDIAPAAGPPTAPTDTPADVPTDAMPPGDIMPPSGGSGTPDAGPPDIGFPIDGGVPCCGGGSIGPGSPGGPPVTPTSPVPESPAWGLLLAGMALIGWRWQRVDNGGSRLERGRSGCSRPD